MTSQARIRRVTDKAIDAFWAAVANEFPLADTGDCSPGATVALDDAATSAIDEWITANCAARPTTGPWHLTVSENPGVYGGEKHFAIIADHQTSNGQILADVETLPEAKANATLMAAAPELLNALENLLRQTVDMDLAHGIGLTEGEQEARQKALAAIARVRPA